MIPAWARHEIDRDWHLIVSAARGQSIVTACNGRWSVTDSYAVTVLPPTDRRCKACASTIVDVVPVSHLRLDTDPGAMGPTGNEAADVGQWRESIEGATERRRDELEKERTP